MAESQDDRLSADSVNFISAFTQSGGFLKNIKLRKERRIISKTKTK